MFAIQMAKDFVLGQTFPVRINGDDKRLLGEA
jgi:hypothetical protein